MTAAVQQIIGGEREEDEREITRPVTKFLTKFRRADPADVQVQLIVGIFEFLGASSSVSYWRKLTGCVACCDGKHNRFAMSAT
eukprot:COSAG01_NODE_1627_length_9684_cov_16.787063_8_plen_83_part_00